MTRDADPSLVDAVDRLLPQTQCTRCGYDGCRPYAEAIVHGGVAINRCPPGGASGIRRLAGLLGRPELPLDADCGAEAPLRVARIVAALCIGCTRCIQVCPVDAIAGAPRRLHAVITELCTGCELCLPPCPTDCIEMVPAGRGWTDADSVTARDRFERRQARLGAAGVRAGEEEPVAPVAPVDHGTPDDRKRAIVQAAIARARARTAGGTSDAGKAGGSRR
jgi:Na+-translocating ferredoxin:NAD+ oxidoreductase subunit B